jgi:chaperone BCS1
MTPGDLPPGLADATAGIPGFGFIAQILLKTLGIDVGNIVSLYLLLFGLYQGANFLWRQCRSYLLLVAMQSTVQN